MRVTPTRLPFRSAGVLISGFVISRCSPLLTTPATITVSPPRNAAATKTSPAEFTICTSLAMQRADAGGPALTGDDDFGVDAMLAKQSFCFGDPTARVQPAHRTQAHANLVLGCPSAAPTIKRNKKHKHIDARFMRISLLLTTRSLLLTEFRQRLLQITVVDVFRRLRQRFLQNALVRGDIDHRAHAFDVQIGIAIPDAAFPVVVEPWRQCSRLITISLVR